MNRPLGLGWRTEVAMTGIAALVVIMLRRVFADWTYLPEVMGAALIPIMIGALIRRMRLPASLGYAVSALVGWLYIAWTLFPEFTAYGVPWKGALTKAWTDLHLAWDEIPTEIAPVPVDTGFLLLATVGVWLLSMAADTLAVSWELPLLGLLPWIALVSVIGAVGTAEARAGWAVLFIALAFAYLALCAVDERLRHTRPLRVDGRTVGPSIRGIAIVGGTVVLALALAPAVPGFGDAPLVRYRTGLGQGDRVGISPLVDIKFRLQQTPPIDVFSVTAAAPAYWRVLALDDFNGTIWGASGRYREAAGGLPPPPGQGPSRPLHQEYVIKGLQQFWLPAAYAPRTVQATEVRVDPRSLTLATDRETAEGLAYAVDSSIPAPSAEALRAVDTVADPADLDAEKQLPAGFPTTIVDEAIRLTADAPTRYDKVRVLQDHFRNGFEYSEEPPAGHSQQSMETFLFEFKRGYCEQFSSTMAAMVRALGIPARVAVGFTPGVRDPTTLAFEVSSRQAHAWVEVYFPTYGWLQFDPTPSRFDPNPANYNGTQPADASASTTTTTPTSLPPDQVPPVTNQGPPEDDSLAGGPALSARPRGVPRIFIYFLIAVMTPILIALAIMGVKSARRRSRIGAPPGRLAQSLWHEVVDLFTDAGLPVSPSDTALETTSRAVARFRIPVQPITALARGQYGELFAAGATGADDVDLRACERDVRAAVLAALPGAARLRARLSVRSLRRSRRPIAVDAPAPAFVVPGLTGLPS